MIVIDMDMPEKCGMCRFLEAQCAGYWCIASGRQIGQKLRKAGDGVTLVYDVLPGQRPEWCPLMETGRCRDCVYFSSHADRVRGADSGSCDLMMTYVKEHWYCAVWKEKKNG